MKKSLGTFEVESGRIFIGDPCYDKHEGIPAINGKWKAYVNRNFQGQVCSLVAIASAPVDSTNWEHFSYEGVDSGQMSIFDMKHFKTNAEVEGMPQPKWMTPKRIKEAGERFYGAICTLTSSHPDHENEGFGGVTKHGCVSITKWGDGSYPCKVKKNRRGAITAVRIQF